MMKNCFFSLLLGFVQLPFYCFSQTCPILPTPQVYNELNESISFNSTLKSNFEGVSDNLIKQCRGLAKNYHNLEISNNSSGPMLIFNKLHNVINDSYSISVADVITISYSSDASCYYAFNSLMQLISSNSGISNIKKCFVKDYPKYSWRGLHLDVSRHFFTVNEVKRYLDLMSYYKFNTFHWHLTDDQGWRIEIKQFPKLTEVGAWRDSTVNNHFSTTPRTYKKEQYGGFYTQEEIKEVVAYAASKYITVVPEIEMPGHSRAALAAYPEYGCVGNQLGVEGLWGVFDDIFCSKVETITFLQKILDEVVQLFPGEYIHIGGDEAPKTRWKNCKKCQGVISQNHLKDEHELQSFFIKQMDSYLSKRGKKLIGWDEILEGGLSPNAAVMSWRGIDGGIEAASQEHYVVMSPGSHCYFDHYQGKGIGEPLAIGGYTPLKKVYEYNPIPEKLDTRYHSYILGAQANVWTEYITNFNKVEYMVYPRAIALSQVLWCDTKPLYNDFLINLILNHFPLLDKWDVNYSKTILKPNVKPKVSSKGIDLEINKLQLSKDSLFTEFNNIEVERARNNKQIKKIKISLAGVKNSSNDTLYITNHLALGAKINFITQPSPQYNEGSVILVDGQYGSRPWKGNDWIGFDTNKIVIDLEFNKKQKINEIELSFLLDIGSWIHTPVSIKVATNHKIIMIKEERCGLPGNYSPSSEKQKIPFKARTKKLRISINSMGKIPPSFPGEGHTPWTFIDEINIR